jgi:hypothetical protein
MRSLTMKRNQFLGLLGLSLLSAVLPGFVDCSRAEVVLLPPGATIAGKTIGEWSANWWQWAAALAPPGDPFTDTNGQYAGVNQSGPVFFLAGSPGGSNRRQFEVPANAYVLVPLVVSEWSQLELGFSQTAAQIRQAAQEQANNIDSLHASFDGAPISQTSLFTHREVSPDFTFVAVANNRVGISGVGPSGIAVADGYFLILGPLTPGIHVLNYGGGASAFGVSVNETDTILVVEPPGANVAGKTIGEWSTNWWQWAAALAPPGDPFTDTTGAFANVNQSGPVFFMAGSPGGVNRRNFDVPANTYLLVPLLVGELSQLELGFTQTAAQIRQAAQQQANNIDSLHAAFDGIPISQAALFTHREVSPDFDFVAVANNQVGIFAVGELGIAVADGYFLMLDPLKPGTHVLNYGGGASAFGISIDETDTITVAPPMVLSTQPIGNQLILSWPYVPGFKLQSTTNLTPPVIWIDSPIWPAATNSGSGFISMVAIAMSGPAQFYRLWKP